MRTFFACLNSSTLPQPSPTGENLIRTVCSPDPFLCRGNSDHPHKSHSATALLIAIANEFSASHMYRKKDNTISASEEEADLFRYSPNDLGRTLSPERSLQKVNSFRSMGTASFYHEIAGPSVSPRRGRFGRNMSTLSSLDQASVAASGLVGSVNESARNKLISSLSNAGGIREAETRGVEPYGFCEIDDVAEIVRLSCSKDHYNEADILKAACLLSPMDKSEFIRQLDASLVTDRDLKLEPLRWQWDLIRDILDFSFEGNNKTTVADISARIHEAIKLKWIKRVTSFFRASIHDDSHFARLDWDPSTLLFSECGAALYQLLMRHGITTIGGDLRRGYLFEDLCHELDVLLAYSNHDKSKSNSKDLKSFLSLESCTRTLSRDYFTFIGKVSWLPHSKNSLVDMKIPKLLIKIGQRPPLDYLSRLALTTLVFTDNKGNPSKALISDWCNGTFVTEDGDGSFRWNATLELRRYMLNIMRALIHSREEEFRTWGVDLLYNHIICIQRSFGDSVELLELNYDYNTMVLSLLEEAFKSRLLVASLFRRRSDSAAIVRCILAMNIPSSESLLLRCLSVAEGVDAIRHFGWMDRTLTEWMNRKCSDYVYTIDSSLSRALNRNFEKHSYQLTCIPVPVSIFESVASSEQPDTEQSVDIEGLLRCPWNMEIKLTSTMGISTTDYAKVDCYLDTSDLISPYKNDVLSDGARVVKVRGLILDAKGVASGIAIDAEKVIIHSSLLLGVCPVRKDGTVVKVSDFRTLSRVKNSTIRKAKNPPPPVPAAPKEPLGNRMRSYSGSSTHSVSFNAGGRSGLGPPEPPVTSLGAPPPVTAATNRDFEPRPGQSVRKNSTIVGLDHLYDWSVCKPGHRTITTEIGEGRFTVEIAGEPVIWIFARSLNPVVSRPSGKRDLSFFNGGRASDTSRAGGFIYLVEVNYFLRLETNAVLFFF